MQSIDFKADFYINRTSGFGVGEGSVVPLKVDGFHGLATATANNGAPDTMKSMTCATGAIV